MNNIYTNTKTLDKFIDEYTDDPEKAEWLILGSRPIDLTPFTNLKGIFKCGVGTDNIPETDIPIYFPSDKTKLIIYGEVASFTCSLIMRLAYNNVGTVRPWSKNNRTSMWNKNLLLVGVGKIGMLVLETMETMCQVSSYDIKYTKQKPLEEQLKEADILSLHVPYNESTHEFIDFSLLKEDAILINTARGKLVNEDALYDWLISNPKAQAAFDVFWKEPYDGKLLDLPNFYATPHVASTCDQFIEGLYNDLMEFINNN